MGIGISFASLPPVPGIIGLKSCANTASISESLPLVTAAAILGIKASLSALDIVEFSDDLMRFLGFKSGREAFLYTMASSVSTEVAADVTIKYTL